MNQTTMFDLDATPARYDDMPAAPEPVARARASDPASSHEAAAKMNRGPGAVQRERVIDLVWSHPGNTSKGLVAFTDAKDKAEGLDRYAIARRLSEAEEAGDVHRVAEGKAELRWFPGRKAE